MKRKQRFPQSTVGRYIPGVGMTLTRVNIALVEQKRFAEAEKAKTKYEPLTVGQIIHEFIEQHKAKASHRHIVRATRLVA